MLDLKILEVPPAKRPVCKDRFFCPNWLSWVGEECGPTSGKRCQFEMAERPRFIRIMFSTPDHQVCWFDFLNLGQKEKSILREPGSPYNTREWKHWKLQWEPFFAPTRLSLVGISIRNLVADGNSLVRNSGVGGGGQNRFLNSKRSDLCVCDIMEGSVREREGVLYMRKNGTICPFAFFLPSLIVTCASNLDVSLEKVVSSGSRKGIFGCQKGHMVNWGCHKTKTAKLSMKEVGKHDYRTGKNCENKDGLLRICSGRVSVPGWSLKSSIMSVILLIPSCRWPSMIADESMSCYHVLS